MTRTKWMRLVVRDLADVLRWAEQQHARQIDAFRYRVIGGREAVSFRLVPRYPIRIGAPYVVVVAIARGTVRQALARQVGAICRRALLALSAPASDRTGISLPDAAPVRTAELRRLPRPR
jgi:hypothetical protein